MGIEVRGTSNGAEFKEVTQTISVSAHGCMMRLDAKLTRGQRVVVVNAKTAEERACTVTYIGQKESVRPEVGIEFVEASPIFWRIAFPPEDWDPSERKRPSSSKPPAPVPPKPRS